jgi:uncharacterized protein YndB with AHSA1/START domain
MKKLHFEVAIRAPRQTVWDRMLGPESYREWTRAFAEGSYYEGTWDEGARILFLSPGGEGMFARIAENRRHERIVIEHLGIVKDGKEDHDTPLAQAWAGAHEAYTFSEAQGVTTVKVEVDSSDEMDASFSQMWPQALARLKAICEQDQPAASS